ncbi:MAG: hypothetical protein JW809_12850 [Pirellulales bacterium]|nr:hypothetical protein [Pirellulales bacterium]
MSRERIGRVWPFLALLICLFLISLGLPRSWQRIARPRAAEQLLGERRAATPAESTAAARTSAPVTLAVPVEPEFVMPSVEDEPIEPPTSPELSWVFEVRSARDPSVALAAPAPSDSTDAGWVAAPPEAKYAGSIPDPLNTMLPPGQPSAEQSAAAPPDPSVAPSGDAEGAANDRRDVPSLALRPSTAEKRAHPPAEPTAPLDAPKAPPRAAPKNPWQSPETLLGELAALAQREETAAWARRVEDAVGRLGQMAAEGPDRVVPVCRELDILVKQGGPLADRLGAQAAASELRRAAYALRRRLEIWVPVLTAAEAPQWEPDSRALALAVADVQSMASDSAEGRAWREYLLLDALGKLPRSSDAQDAQRRRTAARYVLARVAHAPLESSQRDFLRTEPLARLGTELGRAAAGPLDRARLLACVEQFERTRLPSDAQRLAEEGLWLGLGEGEIHQKVSRRLGTHYRNANIRIALSESLLNRFMPEQPVERAPVRDVVLGRPVRGESLTETNVAVRLIPDPRRLRLALEITGDVAALTSSTSGPATFHNASQSHYIARKPVEITTAGLVLGPAEVEQVDNVTRLRALRTDFDGIPLIGSLVHGVARSQHDAKRSELRREVTQKVAWRAKQRIDDEADARLGDVSDRLRQRMVEPLARMALGPTMIQSSTTEDRLVMRLRLASRRQLGAHTPRPRAPGDSLASVQIHQSAINNVLERLELAGQTVTLPELRQRLADQLGRPELAEGPVLNEDVSITFAPRDAVHVACEDGRVGINLAISELSKPPRAWHDFEVRVHYQPKVEGLSIEMVRDEVIQLRGERLGTGAKVALGSIFSKIFLKNRARQLIPERIRNEPGLADLAVTQMKIADGWVGLALGPARRVAQAPPAGPAR